MRSQFRKRCRSKELMVGAFNGIPHPVAVEIMCQSGVDLVCIDWEHSQISRGRIEDLIRAADVHDTPAMVRVPGHDSVHIAAALDAGASGVLVPRVSNAEEARAVVAATRYPPKGERGVGPGRASAYGYKLGSYLAEANERILLAVQIETAGGLDQVEQIAAVDGVDLIFIGTGDLAVSIGAGTPDGQGRLEAAVDRINNASRAAGMPVGIICRAVADLRRYREMGIQFFLLGSDGIFLRSSLAGAVGSVKESQTV